MIALTVLSVALALPASAEELTEPSSELKFEKAPTVDGKPFLCLAAGIRKKALFRVYAIVYCVEETAGRAAIQQYFERAGNARAGMPVEKLSKELADDAQFFKELMAMPVEKWAQMVFVRDVSKEKMKNAFEESLTKALGKTEKERIDAFVGLLDRDLKSGDKLVLHTKPTGELEVGLSGAPKSVRDPILASAVWMPYLGPDSVAPSLKEAVAKAVAGMRR
jgi:hypothetical protein